MKKETFLQTVTKLKRAVYGTLLVVVALAPLVLFADPGGGDPSVGLRNPLQFGTLEEFLVAILNAIVLILFPFLVLAIVYAGFMLVAAQGKPEKLQEARRALLWVLIGALIILSARAISLAIQATVEEITVQTTGGP